MIALIAAVGNGNVIGHEGKMPWRHLPNDMLRFKALTMNQPGQPVVMGLKTFDSIGKVLPGRETIVLTHNKERTREIRKKGCTVIQDLDDVFDLAKKTRVFIAGGENVYRQFIDKADIAYITRIHAQFPGDTFFPELTVGEWSILNSVSETDAGYKTTVELWVRGLQRKHFVVPRELLVNPGLNRSIEWVTRASR